VTTPELPTSRPTSTSRRVLRTTTSARSSVWGLSSRSQADTDWAPFLEYGSYARDQMAVYRAARPVVDRLADDTGERANLLIEENGLGVYLYSAEGGYPTEIDTRPGERVPSRLPRPERQSWHSFPDPYR